MGGPVARRLLKAGFPLGGLDSCVERLADCVAQGVIAASDERTVVECARIALA
jgi:3-hydroxyisobutyrate dehydrogenase-like beta-hydroxyacid dehydrogenase